MMKKNVDKVLKQCVVFLVDSSWPHIIRHANRVIQELKFNLKILCFLQLKNVDFEGLFGNIESVINLSQRLFETLQDTDSIGERPLFKRRTVERRANQASPSAGCTLHFMSPVNILVSWSSFIGGVQEIVPVTGHADIL